MRSRSAALARSFGDPDALLMELRLLLLDHADPGRRSPTPLPGETAPTTYGVPAPVLRAVVSALRRRSISAPLASLALVERLWQAGSLEERKIAAELLALVASLAPAEAWRLIEALLPDLSDSDAADILATTGSPALMRADPESRLKDVQRWLGDRSEWTRRFAVMAIAALARDKAYHDPAALLEALRPVMADSSAEVRRAVVTALWEIAPKGMSDFVRFVQAYAISTDPNIRWIMRQTMNGLPGKIQQEVEARLKAETGS